MAGCRTAWSPCRYGTGPSCLCHRARRFNPRAGWPSAFQSGWDRFFGVLTRKHGRQKYFDLFDRIREARPDMAMSGDFIVGFPGETDREFEDTMDLVRRVTYASAFSFMYSPRPGTPAATMAGQVPEAVSRERLQALQTLLFEQQAAFNESRVGMTIPVLFERPGKFDGHVTGRSPWLQPVYVDGDADQLIGQIVPVKIESGGLKSLSGRLVDRTGASPLKQRDAARRAVGAT